MYGRREENLESESPKISETQRWEKNESVKAPGMRAMQ
jgi:hypothetical protein